jgi:glycosyltransferase involved in cell wall biosynthesis
VVSTDSRSKSVVFLVSHSSAGGVQEIWADLAEGFRERGYATSLVALYPGASRVQTTSAQIPWTYIVERKPASPLRQVAMLKALVRFLAARSPSIVFTAMPAANVLASAAATLAGPGVTVATSHHSPAQTHSPILNLLDGLTGSLKAVGAVISVSKVVDQSLDSKAAVYRAKRRVITNALPPRIEAHIAGLAVCHAGARRRVVVASGRLAAQKNYPVLLRAAARMPDVDIQIIGAGPDEDALKVLAAKLGVADRVNFLGFLAREEALERLSEGDVFVQPSLFEGHSLALIEAAKLGLPLVVSDAPVQIEGITAPDGARCGVAVGVHDDAALAHEILRLMDEPDHHADFSAKAQVLGAGVTYGAMVAAYEALATTSAHSGTRVAGSPLSPRFPRQA